MQLTIECRNSLVSIHERVMALLRVQFINEKFFRCAKPHKGLRRGVLIVRRSRKPADNPALGVTQREKCHLWMDTR